MEDNLSNQMTRDDFMKFFRDDEKLNELSVDDRIEVFQNILSGGSKLTKELLEEVLSDYGVNNLEIVNSDSFKRENFMAFFRDNQRLNDLNEEDRLEVFKTILLGSSDFTKEFLTELLSNYGVNNFEIREIKNG